MPVRNRARKPGSLAKILRELVAIRARFGEKLGDRKVELIRSAAKLRFPSGRVGANLVRKLHDSLLFLTAYPDSNEVHKASLAGLRALKRSIPSSALKFLGNSGIVGSLTEYPFDFPNAYWLSDKFGRDVSIDWDGFEKTEDLETLLGFISGSSEDTGLEDAETTGLEWLKFARGSTPDLQWITRRVAKLDAPPRLKESLFDSLGLVASWRLRDFGGSQTGNILSESIVGPIFLHDEKLIRRAPEIGKWIRRPVERGGLCDARKARDLLDSARAALSTRDREMFPITYADPKQVYLYNLERGLSIMVCAPMPERLLYPESLWGFLGLKNGVPIGYGCFSVLFGSADIAFNVFEPFRQGESGLFYAQLLRVIHHHARATTFCVDTSQFGEDSEEAIKSGAYWFYHKLGFRPFDVAMLRKVKAEEKKIKARPGYRSSPAKLIRMTTANIFLHCGEPSRIVLGNIPIERFGRAVTREIAKRWGADREGAVRAAREKLERSAGIRLPKTEPADELALIFGVLPNIENWKRPDLQRLAKIIVARGSRDERRYILESENFSKLRKALIALLK